MLEDIQSADAGKMFIVERKLLAVVELIETGRFPGVGDVRLRDIDTVGFEAFFRETGDHLPDATPHVQYPSSRCVRAEAVRVFRVEAVVPVLEEFRVSFV